jgi:hypothetical protein
MSDEPTYEQIREAAEAAVGLFLSKLGSDLSTGKFVLMVEVLSDDGTRPVWTATGENQQAWDTLGLLQYGIQREQAAITSDYLEE